MPRHDDADIAAILDDAEFAITACYTPAVYSHPSSRTKEVNVLFDPSFVNVDGVESKHPVATGRASDFTDVTHGAKLTIDDVLYLVRGIERDGTGLIALVLEKQ